ncbi:uncharacterized protein LOC110703144 [Chenopodium quinoa]|uniref:uncharacterized protein LOC110703144 n=1 Tax=Chenopodium quinoa TaxID=63459 RepID=UPI000B78FFE7|nr:uncharacterized protein LOC110703144 [Chenopodium quinoa]
MARDIWQHSQYRGLVEEAPTESFASRWVWLDQKVQGDGINQIAALIWVVWRCRNLFLFEGIRSNPIVLAGNLCKWVADYCTYAKCVFYPHKRVGVKSNSEWIPPPRGVLKLNVDAHVGSAGKAAVGVVGRNEEGTIILTATQPIFQQSLEIAEAVADRYGMIIARRFGFENIWIESDSLNVISTISSSSKGYAPIFNVFDDIRHCRAGFYSCIFSHAKCSCNTVAHLVARDFTGDHTKLIRFDSFPQSIVSLAKMDLPN